MLLLTDTLLINKEEFLPIVRRFNFSHLIDMMERYKSDDKVSSTLGYYYRTLDPGHHLHYN